MQERTSISQDFLDRDVFVSITGIYSPLRLFSLLTDDNKVERSTFRLCFRYFTPVVPSDYMMLQ